MTYNTEREPQSIAISISESPDMAAFGVGEGHLRHAMADTALYLLASGRKLAYGGELRSRGFAELLSDLVFRYRSKDDTSAKVTDYLAWPVHIQMNYEQLSKRAESVAGFADLVLLSVEGRRLAMEDRQSMPAHSPDDAEWDKGLTSMRLTMRSQSDARIVLGGRVDGYMGHMPGVAEEALLSLEAGQPVFLAGGFGGCARDITETLGLVNRWAGSRPDWPGRRKFNRFREPDLRNGLTLRENRRLAHSPQIDQVVALILRGLNRLRSGVAETGATHDKAGGHT